MLSSEILTSAADLLERYEWVQQYLACDHEGRSVQPEDTTACKFCLLGAIWHFNDPDLKRDPNTQAAKDAVSRVLNLEPNDNGAIALYNDAPERTRAEVITTLREAARQETAAGR